MTIDDVDVRELRYNVDGASGGVIVGPGATEVQVQAELDKATTPHGFRPPIDTIVVALDGGGETPAEPQARQTDTEAETTPPVPEDQNSIASKIVPELKTKSEAYLEGTPDQPVLGPSPEEVSQPLAPPLTTFQAGGPAWSPSYVNSTAWELEPGISTFRHDMAWEPYHGFISDVADDFGFEIGDKQRNYTLTPDGNRPACEARQNSDDSAFWARREGGGRGAPKTWTVMIPGSNGSQYKPYWDSNNWFDSCQEMEFALGIGEPQKIARTPGTLSRVFTEVRAARGNQRAIRLNSGIQTPSNDCNDILRDPHSDCMGLNTRRGNGAVTLLADEPGRTVPGSWHTRIVNGAGIVDFDIDQCATYGRMRDTYQGALGGKFGPLGTCRTWAYDAARGGQGQNFANGRLYWHPAVAEGRANGVWGQIGDRYFSLAAEKGPLLYPTTSELPCPARGGCAFNRFENGNIYWSATTGAHGIWGAIFDAYGRNGFENGRLGLPISSEFETPDGRQVNFERGWIRWIRANGAIVTS